MKPGRVTEAPAAAGATRGACVIVITGLAAAFLSGAARAPDAAGRHAPTRDQPPTAVTGGFGEPTCQLCHSEAAAGAGPGHLTVAGVPAQYESGASYTITLTVVHPGVLAAGFELAARFTDGGAQAGQLAPPPGQEERVAVTTDGGIAYAHHLRGGTAPVTPDTAMWQLAWTAPPAGGTVSFHAVANAGNDDDSPLGDYVYTATAASRPQ